MRMNKTSFDNSKKKFYENLKARKEEIESEIDAAKNSSDFCEFDTWEKINGEYRFLKDMLGPIYYQGVPQFDYNGLLNLPKFKWVDSEGGQHIHALIGTHTPGYYGFLAANNIESTNNSIDISVIEPNPDDCSCKEDERKVNISVNTNVIQPKLTAGAGIHISSDNVISADGVAAGNVGYDVETKALYVKDEEGQYNPITELDLVSSEANIRQASDTTLTNNLNTEITARENADNVLDTKINTKITLLGNEQYSGEPYHFPFNFDAKLEDNKIKVHLDTITLDNNKTRVSYDKELALHELGKVDDVKVNGVSVVTDKIANIDLTNKMDLLGNVPGHTDLPYNLPYFFEASGDGQKLTITAKTISLDNKKTQGEYSLDVQSATTTTAGLMSAEDKTKLGDAQSKVKYSATEPEGSKEGDIWMF